MSRLLQQIEFIKEIDKLKLITRRSILIYEDRYENTAEHSWHFAVMAFILAEHYTYKNLDMLRVLKMALIHDIAEIYADDTYCYDQQAVENQALREREALIKILATLPNDQREEILLLWEEFEEAKSHEARFARVIDRLSPFLLNFFSGGKSWQKHEVRLSQINKRMGEIAQTAPEIWAYIEKLLEEALANNWIIKD